MRELRRLFVTWLAVYLLVTSLMFVAGPLLSGLPLICLLYTSDAADDL